MRPKLFIIAVLALAGWSGLSAAENVKTVGGVARANVKTIGGVAEANIKTLLGVDNTSAGGSAVVFTDNFDRSNSDSLGANWTEAAGGWTIDANVLEVSSISYAHCLAIYSGMATTGGSQHVQVTLSTAIASSYPSIVLRYTNSSSPFYAIQFRITEQVVRWLRYADVATTSTTLTDSSTLGTTTGDVWIITIDGTDNDIVIRGWKNPGTTYDAARDTASNVNGDTTPDFEFTTNDGSPVNSGTYVGVQGYQAAANRIMFNDFQGGDL